MSTENTRSYSNSEERMLSTALEFRICFSMSSFSFFIEQSFGKIDLQTIVSNKKKKKPFLNKFPFFDDLHFQTFKITNIYFSFFVNSLLVDEVF